MWPPMGGPGRGGGLENRDAVCAGKLKDRLLSLQSDGEPLKAAELGKGQGWSWASGPAPECTSLCRTQGDSKVEGGLATVLAAGSEASGGQWPWKGATLVSGVHTVAHGPGQGRAGWRSLGACLWACPRVRSPHPSHRPWPCSCAGVRAGSSPVQHPSC